MTLLATLFPQRCPGCGVPAEPVCERCLRRLGTAPILPTPVGLESLVVPFAFEGIVRELIARAKYRSGHATLSWLADAVVDTLRRSESAGAGQGRGVLTWAPTTVARRRGRGFDQAELLARRIGAALGIPVAPRLVRLGDVALTGGTLVERAQRVDFSARSVVAGEWVLVVDDVVTTGATMRAAARALRNAGAAEVAAAAVARRR